VVFAAALVPQADVPAGRSRAVVPD
jgi:hypothetical protein